MKRRVHILSTLRAIRGLGILFLCLWFILAPCPGHSTTPSPLSCYDLLVNRYGEHQHALVPGLYESVPTGATVTVGNIQLATAPSIFPIRNGHNLVTTVTYTEQGVSLVGMVNRMIIDRGTPGNPQRVLIFESAGLSEALERPRTGTGPLPANVRLKDGNEIWTIPTWAQVPGMVPLNERGTPLITLITLMQMRTAGVPRGGLHSAILRNVVNSRVSLELAILVREWQARNPGQTVTPAVLNELVMQTHAVQYARTALEQSGHEIARAEITHSSTSRFGDLRLSARDQADPYIQQLMTRGGLQPNDTLISGLDITLHLRSVP